MEHCAFGWIVVSVGASSSVSELTSLRLPNNSNSPPHTVNRRPVASRRLGSLRSPSTIVPQLPENASR
jgi:hypothetical protein